MRFRVAKHPTPHRPLNARRECRLLAVSTTRGRPASVVPLVLCVARQDQHLVQVVLHRPVAVVVLASLVDRQGQHGAQVSPFTPTLAVVPIREATPFEGS
jgi:hypothetical protein